MTKLLGQLQWTIDHPAEVILLGAILVAVSTILGAILFGVMELLEHRQHAREARTRHFLNRCMQANETPWPIPPGAKGGPWRNGRKSA